MADKERWITLKSGKRVKLDKDGTIIAGYHGFLGKDISRLKNEQIEGELQPFTAPTKSFSEYLKENNNNKIDAVKQYIKENFEWKYIPTVINGKPQDVLFTGRSAEELRKYLDSKKAYFIEYIPTVLQHYKETKPSSEKHKKDFPNFHYFEHVVEKEIKGKKQKAKIILHVGQRAKSHNVNEAYFYGVTKVSEDTKKVGSFRWDNGLFLSRSPKDDVHKNFFDPTCDSNLTPQYEIVNIEIDILEDEPMNKRTVIFDSKSKRSFDINGFMHVELSNLTKESVDPYWGYEIVNSKALGLEQDKLYYGYRKGEELKKAAQTFNGLPLMRDHHFDSAEKPQREFRVGSVGTNCSYNAPYLQASLTITDAEAIRKIESGERVELSCSYFYTAVLEKGEFNGQPYDCVMTDIQGNL